jgi:dolichyl-phosphate-mannose-protein mannosyltransferase
VTDRRSDRLSAALLIVLTVGINLPLLPRYPSPGGDEPGFIDSAVTLATRGFLATDVHRDLLPGIERHVYWQPPLYFVALAGWFRLVGIGLVQARSFSLLCATLVVLGVYVLSRRYAPPWAAVAAATLCAVSNWLTNAARFARMDTLCVALTLGSVFTYLYALDRTRVSLFGLCGVLAVLAFLSHPLGIVAIAVVSVHLLTCTTRTDHRGAAACWLAGGFSCGMLPWLVYILRDWRSFELQMTAQVARKLALGPYWHQFWMAKKHAMSVLVVLSAGFWIVLKRWRTLESSIAVGFLISFAAATYGREAGYFLYFVPWGCCALAVLLRQAHRLRPFVYAAVALAVLNEATILAYDIRRYHHRDYGSLARTVREVVPPGATVFIGFPEVTPYFALLGRNPMRIAVPVATRGPDAHVNVAQACDFIAVSLPILYLPELAVLLNGQEPLAVVDQGPGYRLAVFRTSAARATTR